MFSQTNPLTAKCAKLSIMTELSVWKLFLYKLLTYPHSFTNYQTHIQKISNYRS